MRADTWGMPAGSRDRWPDDYERGRPGWPSEAVDLAGLPSTATVLDLGAGTGKLTRVLTTVFDRVVAVEPAEAMRRLLVAHCPGAETLAGTAHEIPLAEESVDAVFAAQAFHWFDDERAVAEMIRVLRSRGALVLLWNLPGAPTQPSIEAVEQFLTEHGPTAEEFGSDPTSAAPAMYRANGPSPWPSPRSNRCNRRGCRIRRRSTGRGWWRSSPRWAGSLTFPTRSDCDSSTR